MVIEWLLDFVEIGLQTVIGMFPTTNLDLVEYFGNALSVLGDVNYFFPMQELATMFVGFLALFLPFLGTSLALWFVAFLRGGSSRG